MNIFMISFALLIVLGLGATLCWKETISSSFALRAVQGTYEASRDLHNNAEKTKFVHFENVGSSEKKKQEVKKKRRAQTSFTSHRLESPPVIQGRFGIMAIRDLDAQPFVKPILCNLLTILYGHTDWFDRQVAVGLVDKIAIFLTEPEEEEDLTVQELGSREFVEQLDGVEYRLWYLMSKGTQEYDVVKKIGYPPLEDYIDFQKRPIKHTCHFPFATAPLLEAIFGEELTREIMRIEAEKWQKDRRRKFCLQRELVALVHLHRHNPEILQVIERYCYFSQSFGKREFVEGRDKRSKIVIRRRVQF
jgi:hypothetical protein